tara:strand:+ start:129 stop:338 length:210 start_codon:yes stop_codon:yes gene_type:complete
MKNKIITITFIVVAIIVLLFVRDKYSDHNLKKTVMACIVAQQQTSKIFNFEKAKKHCEEEIKKKIKISD